MSLYKDLVTATDIEVKTNPQIVCRYMGKLEGCLKEGCEHSVPHDDDVCRYREFCPATHSLTYCTYVKPSVPVLVQHCC